MWFLDKIIEWLDDAEDIFYDLYLTTVNWIWPFSLLSDFFYDVFIVFARLGGSFSDFNEWVDATVTTLLTILSWASIKGLILSWLPDLETLNTWFSQVTANVTAIITTWWGTVTDTVKGWIKAAVDALGEIVGGISAALTTLSGEWEGFKLKLPAIFLMAFWFSNWWSNILFYLTDWWAERLKEVDTLISDTIKVWLPDYDDLVKLWNDTKAFFLDPVEFIWAGFTNWFLGPEE